MKKHGCIMVIAAVFFVNGVAFAFTQEEAENRIRIAQQLLIKVDSASNLRPYISTDVYNSALSELKEAQSLVNQKNYGSAYYHATMACVKFKALPIMAETKEVREQILALQSTPKEKVNVYEPEKRGKTLMPWPLIRAKEPIPELAVKPEPKPETPRKTTTYEPVKQEKTVIPEAIRQKNTTVRQLVKKETRSGNALSSMIIEASLQRKGDVYRRYVPDSVLFTISRYSLTCSLTSRGEKILDSIVKLVKFTGSSSVTIAGYSSQDDGPGYSLLKAETVSKYLLDAGIPAARIRVYGLGDEESIDTPLGNMQGDRVELIISGLDVE